MTKWVRVKNQQGGKKSVLLNNAREGERPQYGYYVFLGHDEKGTAMPDHVADTLLASEEGSNYELVDTQWHQERRAKLTKNILDEVKSKIPPALKGQVEVKVKEEKTVAEKAKEAVEKALGKKENKKGEE